MQLVDLERKHLEAAADLFATGYREERHRLDLLPTRHEDPSVIATRLARLTAAGPAIAAEEDGRLVGFLAAIPAEGIKVMRRGVFSPEFGHAAIGPDRAGIYRAMYERLAAAWAADGCLVHALAVLAHDDEAVRTWFWTGFGMQGVDAVRPLTPVGGSDAGAVGLEVREARAEDIPAFMPLSREHELYYQSAPIFFPPAEPEEDEAFWAAWLDWSANHLWLAVEGTAVIGMMKSGPANPGASSIAADPGTCSISGAYVRPDSRRAGVGTALLTRVVGRAREEGYVRCCVDFEAHNIRGSAFWLKHFTPFSYSLIRRLDERIMVNEGTQTDA
ncbi:MAG: GNAT family N-acetyltransferase [Bacillota bacterium]